MVAVLTSDHAPGMKNSSMVASITCAPSHRAGVTAGECTAVRHPDSGMHYARAWAW